MKRATSRRAVNALALERNPPAAEAIRAAEAGQTLLDVVDQKRYELPDMVHDCPFHHGTVSSLTCTLTKDCHDMCKKEGYTDSASPDLLKTATAPQPK